MIIPPRHSSKFTQLLSFQLKFLNNFFPASSSKKKRWCLCVIRRRLWQWFGISTPCPPDLPHLVLTWDQKQQLTVKQTPLIGREQILSVPHTHHWISLSNWWIYEKWVNIYQCLFLYLTVIDEDFKRYLA